MADEDSATTEWDIGFNATSIIVNGGSSGHGEGDAVGLDIAFVEVTTEPSEGYSEDGMAHWYNYNENEGTPPAHGYPQRRQNLCGENR